MLYRPYVSNLDYLNTMGVIASSLQSISSTVTLHPFSIVKHHLNYYTFLNLNMITCICLIVFILHLLTLLTVMNSIFMLVDVYSLVSLRSICPITYLIFQLIKSLLVEMLSFMKVFSSIEQFLTSNMNTDHHILLLRLRDTYYGCENSTNLLPSTLSRP